MRELPDEALKLPSALRMAAAAPRHYLARSVAKNMFFRGPSGELVELMQVVSGEF